MAGLIESEEGVSNILGFILVIGILLIAIGMVFASGGPIIDKSKKVNNFMEMKRSFMLINQNIEEVVYGRAPIRNTELKLNGGTISTFQNSYLTFEFNNTVYTYPLGTLEYFQDNNVITYENGGIWIRYNNDTSSTTALSKPRISIDDDLVIPITEVLGTEAKGGIGFVRILVMRDPSSYLHTYNTSDNETTISITGENYKGWEDYFKHDLLLSNVTVNDTSQTVSMTINVSTVYIDVNRLRFSID